jgi:hypothetical protein
VQHTLFADGKLATQAFFYHVVDANFEWLDANLIDYLGCKSIHQQHAGVILTNATRL